MHKDDPLEYLWEYFDRHSSQRIQMFNYYILVNIAVLTGIGVCLKDAIHLLLLPALLLLFLNTTFKKLDQRTVFLIKQAEKSIKIYEKNHYEECYRVFSNEEINKELEGEEISSYSKIFNGVYNLTDFIALIFIAIGIVRLFI